MKDLTNYSEPEVFSEAITRQATTLLEARRSDPNDPIERLFSATIPKELWHYTSIAGLEGILESGRIWATEAHFTTDPSEFIHARDLALGFLHELVPTTEEGALAKQLVTNLITAEFEAGFLSQSGVEVFVASFSSAENLKSQWSDYADHSQGVSIAFDLRQIRPPAELELAVTLAPCVYEVADKQRLIKSALSNLMNVAASLHRNTGDTQWVKDQLRDQLLVNTIYDLSLSKEQFKELMEREISTQLRAAAATTTFDLLRLASHCKDTYYEEEKEWRLALPHTKGTPLTEITIEHRGPQNQIPYVAHDLFSGGHLPIIRIMTGPLCTQHDSVEQLVKDSGYNIPIMKSQSPIRRVDEIP
jgi:hypothetical protein